MEDIMRAAAFSILLASAMVTGCGRPDSATPGNALASPAGGPASDGARAPVVAVGRAEAPRPAEANPAADAAREITIPSGTTLNVTLDTAIGSDTSRVEEAVTAHLARPIH